jgi:hypothetical protein
VVPMPRAFNELAAMLSYLAVQTLAPRLEVVLVHTPAGRATIDARRRSPDTGASSGALRRATSTSSFIGSRVSIRAKRPYWAAIQAIDQC